jgi:FAD/FMN-containing dehydrogenase
MDKRFPIQDQIAMLAAALKGRVVTPSDTGYDDVRGLLHGNFDFRPAAVIQVANAADVAAVINFAQATDLKLTVRGGGHSGHGATDSGLKLDLRALNSIEIDVEGRNVWAGGGLTAGEVTRAVEQHGLIVGFGDTASVGIGGLTTGGGIGYMARKHGLTIDSLLAVEIVTAGGDILIADETNHPDLFWAVRGGGGNFGVVTRFKYRLHPLPQFTGGPLVLPATPEVVTKFVELAHAAPEELTAITYVMTAPPLPFLPEELHGQVVYLCMMAYSGAPQDAEKALAPFRAITTPIADLVGPAPYSSLYAPDDPAFHALHFSVRQRFVDNIRIEEATRLVNKVNESNAMFRVGEIRVLGGAFGRVPETATAFAHRSCRIMIDFVAATPLAEEVAANDAWAQSGIDAMAQGDDRVYVNFLMTDFRDRVRAAYPGATWAKLRAIKKRYDPENLFRGNANIPPA